MGMGGYLLAAFWFISASMISLCLPYFKRERVLIFSTSSGLPGPLGGGFFIEKGFSACWCASSLI